MTSKEIRQAFLDFFAERGHTIVKSASLVPENDPTLLFTNAGMNQFKDVFLGTGKRNYTRAADTQKCMRVSGKHNDLDDVGKDTYHHTLFEMLGNWSFGDYYKKEAIEWAWEFLTSVFKLPKDKLYATVYKTDDESFELWGRVTDIEKSHILRFGEKDNFWEMGDTGPCGPCSEIHIDLGENACDKKDIKGHKCEVNAGCARFIEIWNLVFIQYNRLQGGTLQDLPAKHVDTGMGFERLVAVVQGKHSNYDTDLFTPIINKIGEISGHKYREKDGMAFRVISDHIRALTFALADGIMPSNEGRGYVLRKILRRATRYGKTLGFDSPFLYDLVDSVVEIMGEAFPEVADKSEMIKSVIQSEEESFFRTLNRGMDKLSEIVSKVKSDKKRTISGDDIFLLYDSMGFPLDFTEQVAKDENLSLDMERFNELMGEQKERARASWKGDSFDLAVIAGKTSPSLYEGENLDEIKGKINLLARDNEIVDTVKADESVAVIADRTVFYAERGGQVGDKGVIRKGDSQIAVYDTKIFEDAYIHYGTVISGEFKTGDTAVFTIDGARKKAIARNHTATHLIHKALKETVGVHATQAGSLVAPDRLRFDFTHNKALSKDEIEEIENRVNTSVLNNIKLETKIMSKSEAMKRGAEANFEEKYGDTVRVVNIGGYSMELCGGTHVTYTGEIGLVKIISEGSISAGTRRLEAITGLNSLEDYRSYFYRIKELSSVFKVDDEKVVERVMMLLETLRAKEREINELRAGNAVSQVSQFISEAETLGDSKIVIRRVDMESSAMVKAVDGFKEQVERGVIFLITSQGEKVVLVAGVTKPLVSKIKAGDIARETAKVVGGGGGGRPDFAQAGGKDISKIEDAITRAKEIIKEALG
jgi:alanyl-tRNA synthetase